MELYVLAEANDLAALFPGDDPVTLSFSNLPANALTLLAPPQVVEAQVFALPSGGGAVQA